MKSFKSVYSFEVIQKIKEGHTIMMLDKEKQFVETVNEMEVSEFVKVLAEIEANNTRYYFYEQESN